MEFIAYVVQHGGGCDYTIGCAQTLWVLEATNRPDAIDELKQKITGGLEPGNGYWGDRRLSRVTLYEVNGKENVPVDAWYREAEAVARNAKNQAEANAEMAEYIRLRAKFEPLRPGTQIIYVPTHASGDTSHPDCEAGFVTSVRGDNAFCRYWSKSSPGELRTKANSELTPINYLVIRDTVSQFQIDRIMKGLENG